MTKPNIKYLITEAVLKQSSDNSWTIDESMSKWWMTMRNESGMRLTEMGDLAFRHAQIEFYNYDFDIKIDSGWHNFILDLNKKIKCPYYIGVNKTKEDKQPFIRFYDSKIAMMVGLYGDLNSYLKSIKVRQ